MDLRNNESLIELLAAQYALGTLRGGARRRFETLCRQDRALDEKVRRWQEHFAPLAELVPEVKPPARVWDGIVARIPALRPAASAVGGWLNSLALWRGVAAVMGVVAVVSLGIIAAPNFAPGQSAGTTELFTTFTAPDTKQPLAILLMPDKGDHVVLKVVAPTLSVPKDKSLQLWLVSPGSEALVSAGVAPQLDADGTARFAVSNAALLRGAKALGLSLEPVGGSPQPTHALGFGAWDKDAT
jgi:anti-sigma-K factor RskA